MSERDLIQFIRNKHKTLGHSLKFGIGDDCAVFGEDIGGQWVVSTDMLVENIHFNLAWHSAFLLGRKAVAVNLSDIAAMGATPNFILLSVSIPKNIQPEWIDDFMSGVEEILTEYNTLLIGGDTVQGPSLSISITAIGNMSGASPIFRNGARVGDDIYVSGQLGSSALGLELLRSSKNDTILTSEQKHPFIQAHLNPTPQVAIGRALAKSSLVHSMQDISDGISTDLAHICSESNVGAYLLEEKLPMHENLVRVSSTIEKDSLKLILSGGEDYQLLFTAQPSNESAIFAIANEELICNKKLYKVGKITDSSEVVLKHTSGEVSQISYQGFEHL